MAIDNPLVEEWMGLGWRWTSGDLIQVIVGGHAVPYLRRREVQRRVRRALSGLVRQGLVARSWQADRAGYRWASPARIPAGTWTHQFDDALVFTM